MKCNHTVIHEILRFCKTPRTYEHILFFGSDTLYKDQAPKRVLKAYFHYMRSRGYLEQVCKSRHGTPTWKAREMGVLCNH